MLAGVKPFPPWATLGLLAALVLSARPSAAMPGDAPVAAPGEVPSTIEKALSTLDRM